MFSRKSNNNWMLMSSAIVGGFLLGVSYKKYSQEIKNGILHLSKKNLDYDNSYTTSHEPDA